MAVEFERPGTEEFNRFYSPDLRILVSGASMAVGLGRERDFDSPRNRVIFAARSLFEEAIGEAMSELAISTRLDLNTEEGRHDFLTAIQVGGSLALIELRGPEHNADFFNALLGE